MNTRPTPSVVADEELVERVARAIDPDAWARRDEDLNRRQEWDAGIKAGWGKTPFKTWANRFVGKSLKLARAALAAMKESDDGPR